MSQTTIHKATVAGVLREAIASADDPFLVTSSPALLRACVTVLDDVTRPAVRVLAPKAVLRDICDDFRVASAAADLIAAGRLTLRTDETVTNTLVITADAVVALERTADHVVGLPTADEAFVASANDHYGARWAAAEDFALRTPPLSEVRETLEDEFGPEFVADFDEMLATIQTARRDGDGLDAVTISLLVAAKHEQLFYDVSKWGEDVGLVSKATFSRAKMQLEEVELIETEKAPIDIGRPRLRLLLGDDRLPEADATELASTAQSVLAPPT